MLERIWRWLTNWCQHRWEIHEVRDVYYGGERPIGQKFILRCTRCGDIKVRNTY